MQSQMETTLKKLSALRRMFNDDPKFLEWYCKTSFDEAEFQVQLDQQLAEKKELAMLRRIHGKRWVGKEGELEALRRVHERWQHPARSDRGKYVKIGEVYWNGDVV